MTARHRVAPVNPAGLPTAYEHGGRLTADAARAVDPILVEIVQGTLASVEMEVETAIARTSRSPMIRDAHDFRAGIHDRQLRKLTGRSYSALVHPIARDFPLAEMREGDVFFHNDVYESEGGIGHLPDLCVTVPVFAGGEVVAFVQAFGHHDDIGGAVPGLDAERRARAVFEEGLSVPPIKLWDKGVPNQAALRDHDPQLAACPTRLAADLDAECSACLMGARRLVRAVRALRPRHRRGGLRRDPRPDDGDLPPRDPLQDPRRHLRLGGLRRARRRRRAAAAHPADHADQASTGGRRPRATAAQADHRLHRHGAAGQGPDQPLRRLRRRQLPQEVARADPAQPRRHPRADGRARRQRGHRAADRDAVPREGHPAHADLPGADQRPHLRHPAPARRAGRRRRQGGRRQDARRPGDDPLHRRLRQGPRRQRLPHARGARRRLGRALLRRRRGHHPRRARLAGTCRPSSPRAGSRSSSSGSAWPSTPAAPGATAAASATRSTSGCSRTPTSCPSPTARSSPAGASRAARPVMPFKVTVDLGGPDEREVDALADAEPVKAGQVDPHPHHRRRRLGRPARPSLRRGRARPALGQGLLRRARAATTASSPPATKDEPGHRHRPRPTRCASSCARTGPPSSRSSTVGPATRRSPRDGLRPMSTGSDRDDSPRDRRDRQDRSRRHARACLARGRRARCGALHRGREESVCRWGPVDLGR